MGEREHLATVRVGSWALAVLPMEIDLANAAPVGEDLGALLAAGVGVVILDMSSTTFCDTSGVRVLVEAHQRAQASGTELRLVVPAIRVRRVFQLLGVDKVLRVYVTLGEAMAGSRASAGEPPGDAPTGIRR